MCKSFYEELLLKNGIKLDLSPTEIEASLCQLSSILLSCKFVMLLKVKCAEWTN
jgi:hypothetical protein